MDFSTFYFLFRYSIAKCGALKKYKQAIENQKLQPDSLNIKIEKQLEKLLTIAFLNVPWYHEQFVNAGIRIDDLKDPSALNRLPVLRRNDLVENFDKFISKNVKANKLKISTTGGSTGTPVKVGMDRKAIREVPKWQMLSWWGLSPSDNMASIYRGIPVSGIRKIALDLIHWPQHVVRMDATNISNNNIDKFISEYTRSKPKLVHGYVGALDALADYIIENKIELPSPTVVWSTASPITSIQSAKIEKAFNAPVCDQYGCSEMYFIAAECPHKRGLHIFADNVKVEILDENDQPVPDGEYGKIVITNLNDFSFPLIRYQNGDTGRILKETCTCGLTLPLMDKVKGRISDNIILPDKTILSGEFLTTIFDNFVKQVKQFQIVQKKSGELIIKIVAQEDAGNIESLIQSVNDDLQKRIKFQIPVSFEKVDEIVSSKGKLQFIIKE